MIHSSYVLCQEGYEWYPDVIVKNNVKKVTVYPKTACRMGDIDLNNSTNNKPLNEYLFDASGRLVKEVQYGSENPAIYNITTHYCYFGDKLIFKKVSKLYNEIQHINTINYHWFDSINVGLEIQFGKENVYSVHIENYQYNNTLTSIHLDGFLKNRAKIVSYDKIMREDSSIIIQETHRMFEGINWGNIISSEFSSYLLANSIETIISLCYEKRPKKETIYKYVLNKNNNIERITEISKDEIQHKVQSIELVFEFELDKYGLVKQSTRYRKNLDSGETLLLNGCCYIYEFR